MIKEGGEEQVSWNLQQQLLWQIANMLEHAGNNYIAGDLTKSFYNLKNVKFKVIQNLKQEERNKLTGIEKEIGELLIISNNKRLRIKNPKLHKKALATLKTKLEEYLEQLMDYLETYGFLLQKKDDITKWKL
jgi:hypothetical protein